MSPQSDAFDSLVHDVRQVLTNPGARAEISVYTQFERFLYDSLGRLSDLPLTIVQQASSGEGTPDFMVRRGGELLGWVEVKAVTGKNLNALEKQDKLQQERFVSGLSNVLYTNGWQWQLFQESSRIGRDVLIGPADMFDAAALDYTPPATVLGDLDSMLSAFLSHSDVAYSTPQAAVTALAMRAKALKLALLEVEPEGAGVHLRQLHDDFKALLFRNGVPFTWERFVDSYVQIAAFGLLLWRLEEGSEVHLGSQVALSKSVHPLLNQCLSILWMPDSRPPILEPLLDNLCRTINLVSPDIFAPVAPSSRSAYIPDPIVHAYEPFFTAYDRAARESNGVYYTPAEVVQHIVAGVDHLIRHSLGRPDGVLDEKARFLDPATGTGTFLLGLANAVVGAAEVAGLPSDQMVEQVLTRQASAFELSPGPYAIAHQRLETALRAVGAPPTERLPVYLADTLAAPSSGALGGSGFGVVGAEIVAERERADELKTAEELLVIFGNPPWERLKNGEGSLEPFATALLNQLRLATPAESRKDLKSTRDLFIAFWMWALWALQPPEERQVSVDSPKIDTRLNHGMVAFITNRTWLHGKSLVGLRSLIRKGAREVWVYDLGGDARGGHGARSFAGGDQNVFSIQTGAAIAWVVFDRTASPGECVVRYRRLYGSRRRKLEVLAEPFDPTAFEVVVRAGGETMLPDKWKSEVLRAAPRLADLFADEPLTGFQTARDTAKYSPIAVDRDAVYAEQILGKRVNAVRHRTGALAEWAKLSPPERTKQWATAQERRSSVKAPGPDDMTVSKLRQVLYRPLDLRWLYDDPKWVTWYRDDLHEIYAEGAFVPALVTIQDNHGRGPAVMHANRLMDQHSFRGSAGGRAVFPLWRPEPVSDLFEVADQSGRRCSFSSRVIDWLRDLGRDGEVESAYDYILAVLSAPSYTAGNWEALASDTLRVPLTADVGLFLKLAHLGSQVRSAWELDAREVPPISWGGQSQEPLGRVRYADGMLTFDNGRTIRGVSAAAWAFEVSGYSVISEWFRARRHWRVSAERAREARAMIGSVEAIAALGPVLDAALLDLLGD